MSETTFTFRVDDTLKSDFSTAAKALDRTGAQLLREFMRDFVRKQQEAADYDAWFREQVQIGIDDANIGNLMSAEEVEADANAWRTEIREKLAKK
ncbi:CopG family ribbon-helix-helix protein [Xenorhabdus eapokensis]|uniref:Antitoxin n=1 Tax=Xenorhabdus eapokensis TaxID=1873482 RepID=A0A1Q5TXF6_9GAMM|nr:hypothetical protein [Xenorhabdus eapokensis]OKP04901.1 antitoxin [Xenorhabdus eapokensis]OKP05156.1 antitoxin [Xenorhabdus eapokensis]